MDATHPSSFRASASKRRIPSASLSTAIGSWLCSHRNAFSSSVTFGSSLACAASGVSTGVSSPGIADPAEFDVLYQRMRNVIVAALLAATAVGVAAC